MGLEGVANNASRDITWQSRRVREENRQVFCGNSQRQLDCQCGLVSDLGVWVWACETKSMHWYVPLQHCVCVVSAGSFDLKKRGIGYLKLHTR
jgi:hypothetical protein